MTMAKYGPWVPDNSILTPEDAEALYDEHAAHGAIGDWKYFECDACGFASKTQVFDESVTQKHHDLARKLFGGR